LGNWWTQPYFGMVVAAFPTLNPPEIKMKHYIAKIAVVILSGFAVASGLRAGSSADDVGDADTFGHPALLHGRSQRLRHTVLRSVSGTDTNAVASAKWRQLL